MSSPHKKWHVALSGNDQGDGSLDRPWSSPQRALDALAEHVSAGKFKGTVDICFAPGVYLLQKRLDLSARHGGCGDVRVRLIGSDQGEVIFSGGVPVSGWTQVKPQHWQAPLSAPPDSGRQLFIGNRRIPRARLPETGLYEAASGIDPDAPAKFVYQDGQIEPDWSKRGNVEIIGMAVWTDVRHMLKGVDAECRQAVLEGAYPPSGRESTLRYWIDNIREGLVYPDRWYYNRQEGLLEYHSPDLEGEPSAGHLTVLDALLHIEGREDELLDGLHVENITFAHADWRQTTYEEIGPQAAVLVDAAVRVKYASNIVFLNCAFRHLGAYALGFEEGCHHCVVEGCDFSDLGAGAVRIGKPMVPSLDYEAATDTERTHHVEVRDCHICHIGHVYPAAVGVLVLQSDSNTITRNHIHDTHYTGISVGWTWGYGRSQAFNNDVSHNHIHDIGQGLLGDLGGIYTLGIQPGTTIHHNRIHHVRCALYGGNGIYADEGSSDIAFFHNVVTEVDSHCFELHYGRNNRVYGNVFAFGGEAVINRTKEENHRSLAFEENTCMAMCEPFFSGNWLGQGYASETNTFIRCDAQAESIFSAQLISLGSKTYHNDYVAVKDRYDRVRLRGASLETAPTPDDHSSVCLGLVPHQDVPNHPLKEGWPEEPLWLQALTFPPLVTKTGTASPITDTDCRVLQDDDCLYLRMHARYSRRVGCGGLQEDRIEVFIGIHPKVDVVIQLMLSRDNTSAYFRHPPGSSNVTLDWRHKVEETDTGWIGTICLRKQDIMERCGGGDEEWCLFFGRNAHLPPMDFEQWQQMGNDEQSRHICK